MQGSSSLDIRRQCGRDVFLPRSNSSHISDHPESTASRETVAAALSDENPDDLAIWVAITLCPCDMALTLVRVALAIAWLEGR